MDLVIWPNEILNKPSAKVVDFDDDLLQLVDAMRMTMQQHNGFGLAANQVGVLKQITVIDTTSDNGTLNRVFINPVIIEEHGRQMYKEGCLSFPGVYINMPRYETMSVDAQDETGKRFTITVTGLDAVCLQHEIDHLEGITFYDKLGPTKRAMYKNKFKKLKKGKR